MDHVPDLAGCRILVVEDEYLLAIGIADEIEDHGGIVVGPMTTLDDGIRALEEHKPDAAIVNINLGPDKVYPLADQMRAKDVPFVFASSEDRAAIPDRFNDVPLHSKPISMVNAAAALMRTSRGEN